MTVLEISLIISQITTGVGFFGLLFDKLYYHYNIKKPLELNSSNISSKMPELGVSIEAYESTESTENYLRRIIKMYPDAYTSYKREKGKVNKISDRYVSLLIGKINSGELHVLNCGTFTMEISNGDQIWIGNQWYGFGTLYRCPDMPHLQFTYPEAKLGEYAFMCLVDLYYKNKDFTEWRKKTHKHLGLPDNE